MHLEAQEWINKGSGRGELRLIAQPADGSGPIAWQIKVLLGSVPYEQALPELFPWAERRNDKDALDQHDEDEWRRKRDLGEQGMRPRR